PYPDHIKNPRIERYGDFFCLLKISNATQKNVGAGLPAIAVCQPTYLLLTRRYRGQARSHTGSCG
ncbi:MAG: hypothetical protein WBB95_03400, partial [Pseudomonas sp.]|uniref:hypothetical protein n=1 Tax=Pseudomonas sp. TaxID=306 RepID=UPI003C750AD6